jgi:hypothetical protein
MMCANRAIAQELAPSLSDDQFQQIHYRVFHAEQDPVSCVQQALPGGCTQRAPLEMPPAEDLTMPPFDEGLLPSSFGATRGTLSAAPHMFGDFFGGGIYFMGDLVSSAGGDRPFKLGDNWQPLPTDRIYFNYHHFNSVTTGVGGELGTSHQAFDRYTMGIEKTLFGGLLSLDVRAPYASALNATQIQDLSAGPLQGTEFGNLGLATKVLLISRERFAFTGGAGLTFPTGDDYELFDRFGTPVATMQNEAIHLQPFLGFVATPGGRLFLQGICQVDIDMNGNTASFAGGTGRVQSQTLLYSDLSMGFWLYENPGAIFLQGIAPIIEMHYTSAVQDTDSLFGEFTNVFNRQDYLNMTGGISLALGEFSFLTLAAGVPLRSFPDRGFDAETGIQFIRRY